MMNGSERNEANAVVPAAKLIRVHPIWHSFIKYCEAIKNGEIERLKIQNGLPMLAEEVKKKIKFDKRNERKFI